MLINLSIRLGVVVTELENLPLGVIAEYIAALQEKPEQTDIMSQLETMKQQRLGVG